MTPEAQPRQLAGGGVGRGGPGRGGLAGAVVYSLGTKLITAYKYRTQDGSRRRTHQQAALCTCVLNIVRS